MLKWWCFRVINKGTCSDSENLTFYNCFVLNKTQLLKFCNICEIDYTFLLFEVEN